MLLPPAGAGPARPAADRHRLRGRGALRGAPPAAACWSTASATPGPSGWRPPAASATRSAGWTWTGTEQEACFDAFFGATVDPDTFTVARAHRGRGECLPAARPRARTTTAAARRVRRHAEADVPLPTGACAGLVSLVGAGPGDPGLLTLRGRQRLLEADAVVFDRLAATSLPCDLPADVELHCVGKTGGLPPGAPGRDQRPDRAPGAGGQARRAAQGRRPLRLRPGRRGGRGSARAAGIPFEIVPGVTAAVAVPAYAGMPVTHRREAVRATMVTAHEAAKTDGPQVRWDLHGRRSPRHPAGLHGRHVPAQRGRAAPGRRAWTPRPRRP